MHMTSCQKILAVHLLYQAVRTWHIYRLFIWVLPIFSTIFSTVSFVSSLPVRTTKDTFYFYIYISLSESISLCKLLIISTLHRWDSQFLHVLKVITTVTLGPDINPCSHCSLSFDWSWNNQHMVNFKRIIRYLMKC